jgi:hypothetical protein
VQFPRDDLDNAQELVEEEDEQIVEDDDDSPVQPFGDRCIVICRLSSNKMEPADEKLITNAQRHEALKERRRREGRTLAARLVRNCPTPVTFTEVFSTCYKRRTSEATDWQATIRPISTMVTEIRDWFRRPVMRGSKATVLIRAVDGLTCIKEDMKKFLLMIKSAKVTAQIIFQYNRVYDDIRPLRLRNFKGLGGTADFMAADFLAHLEGTKVDPEADRILEIWQHIATAKSNQQGIQDRNEVLRPDALEPIEVRVRQRGRN